MLLLPQLTDANLSLNGFSFKDDELNAVSRSLKRHEVQYKEQSLNSDKLGRKARQWLIGIATVGKLEQSLKIRFVQYGQETVAFPTKDGGKEYCCREITLMGDGRDVETITADDADDALFKCALVAGRKHWLGGNASKGRCY